VLLGVQPAIGFRPDSCSTFRQSAGLNLRPEYSGPGVASHHLDGSPERQRWKQCYGHGYSISPSLWIQNKSVVRCRVSVWHWAGRVRCEQRDTFDHSRRRSGRGPV